MNISFLKTLQKKRDGMKKHDYEKDFRKKFVTDGVWNANRRVVNPLAVYDHMPLFTLLHSEEYRPGDTVDSLKDRFYHRLKKELRKEHSEMLVMAFGKETAEKLRDFSE